MNPKASSAPGYFESIWRLFASVKLTVVVLLSMAGTSIIGTLIPQNEAPQAYLNAFGPFLFQVFHILGFYDMYHAWWFQLLMLILVINIVVCSIERLSVTWGIIFNKTPSFNPARFSAMSNARTFEVDDGVEKMKERVYAMLGKRFTYTRAESMDSGFAVYAEKGRWTRLGVYVVHLSIVFLVAGALIGSLFGFEGSVNIAEGESANAIRLRNSGRMMPLDFEIRCDDFDMTLYKNGMPREFRSRLTLLKEGKPLVEKEIIVNDPLRYDGINIFQASYGVLPESSTMGGRKATPVGPDDEITLSFTSAASGMTYDRKTRIGQSVTLPEGLGTFTVKAYQEAAVFRGQDIGAALTGLMERPDVAPVEVTLPLNFPNFDKMRKGAVVIAVTGYPHEHFSAGQASEKRYYTGLQVTRDPGVWVVYAGFIMIIAGCYITFFVSHQQVCVQLDERESRLFVTVAGTANKNKPAMGRKVEQISEALIGAVSESRDAGRRRG